MCSDTSLWFRILASSPHLAIQLKRVSSVPYSSRHVHSGRQWSMRVLSQGQCKIKYDDGDSWTGDGRYIMRLDGGQGASSLFCQLLRLCLPEK